MRVWIGIAMVVAGCATDAPCYDFDIVGGGTFGPGAVGIAHDPASGTSLIAWSEHRYDAQGGSHVQLDVGLLGVDGSFAAQPPIVGTGDNVWSPVGTDGGFLVDTGEWLVFDAGGGLVARSQPAADIYSIAGAGVPGGFLVAVERVDSVALDRVGLDGTITSLGALGPPLAGPVPLAAARIGDAVWLGFSTVTDGMNLVRTDLDGAIVDRLVVPTTLFAAIASTGDRGLAFDSDGAMYPIDAGGVGAPTPGPAADPTFAYGFPDRGYLVDTTWLELDGTPTGTLSGYPPRVYPSRLIASDDALVATWTTFPEYPAVTEGEPSRLYTESILFGANVPGPVLIRSEAGVTVVSREVGCPDYDYGND
jgi:hypothetical protein